MGGVDGDNAVGADALAAPDTPTATRAPRMTRARSSAAECNNDSFQSLARARASPEDAALYPAKVDRCDADAAELRVVGENVPNSSPQLHRPRTPRPAPRQGAIYRDAQGKLRAASAARAKALDTPPPLPTVSLDMPPPPPRVENRHGINAYDGNRDGVRAPKIAAQNVDMFLDILRLWPSVNARAQETERTPWLPIFDFIASRKAWVEPAPTDSEKLKDRIRTVARSVGTRKEKPYEKPMELVALFGGVVETVPPWAGDVPHTQFPYDTKLLTPKKARRIRVQASYEIAADEHVEEFGSPIPAPAPQARELTPAPVPPAPILLTTNAARASLCPPRPRPAIPHTTAQDRVARGMSTNESEHELDFATLVKRERDAVARSDDEGAKTARLARLGMRHARMGECSTMCSASIIETLANHPPRWPASVQWLQKRDVGAVSQALKHVAKWIWHEPQDIAAAIELIERIIGAFALARALAPGFDLDGKKKEEIRAQLALHCERATFVSMVKFVDKIANEVAARKPTSRRLGSIEEEKARKHRSAARQMVNPQGISIATKLLESEGVVSPNQHTLEELRKLCPNARAPVADEISSDIAEYFASGDGALIAIDTAAVRKAIKSAPKGRTKDIEGVRFEHLQGVIKYAGPEALGALTLLFETMARKPREAFKTISKARMVAIPKKVTQIRPIGITSVFRRIWGKIVLGDVGAAVSTHLLEANKQLTQLAVGVKGGTQTAGIMIHCLRDSNKGHATLQLDVKNAFNELDRSAMLRAAKKFGPMLFSFAAALYSNGTQALSYFLDGADAETIECETGVTQGCGLGTLLFALAFHACVTAELEEDQEKTETEREFQDIMVCAYADDAAITGPCKQILTFANRLSQRLQRDAALTVKEHIFHPPSSENQSKLYGEEKHLAEKLAGFRIATDGIVFAGNPIGTISFVNEEVGKIVAKHATRLAAIREFADTSSIDTNASPFKGFYKHLALALIQHTCDRRLDYALHVTPTTWIDSLHLASAQRHIRESITHVLGGEVIYDKLDDLGKTLFKAPFRLGGQSFHDIVEEADLCFVSNVSAHAPLAMKVLSAHNENILEQLQLAAEEVEDRLTWSKCVINALDDVKLMKLENIDAAAAVPKDFPSIFNQENSTRKKKKQILDMLNDDIMQKTFEKLAHSSDAIDQVQAQTIVCLKMARSRWRGIETLQSSLDFCTANATEDQDGMMSTSNSRMGTNLINDVALPLVMRMCLAQPILSGSDASDFCVAERMGWQALWENRREGYWSTRRRHDDDMKIIGACIRKVAGPWKSCVFEKDAEFARSCFRQGGKVHRPDMVCDNLFDDNIKYVFDLTNASAFTRNGSSVVPRENHLEEAESKKRNSAAWKNFVPADGMTTEFVPVVIGWYGEFGSSFQGFMTRVGSHFGDRNCSEKELQFAAKWRSRRFAAAVQTRHLNTIGVYLNAKRDMYSRVGCARRRNRGGNTLDIRAPARGVRGDGFSNFACGEDGSPLLAIPQHEEIRRTRLVIDVTPPEETLANLEHSVQEVEGLVGGVPLVI